MKKSQSNTQDSGLFYTEMTFVMKDGTELNSTVDGEFTELRVIGLLNRAKEDKSDWLSLRLNNDEKNTISFRHVDIKTFKVKIFSKTEFMKDLDSP